ncbi:potassium channel family protein [Salinisphaera sp. G21_0]|uniref:potassium channel family protein n=1 Tax=Salinisphaera sp. G21_0 TaxID=2821094 RepID=UPI001ADC35B1|nr:potassium channel family protein [Salinisphaera sp. G21_0]MBO9481694.1 two pore domain potassium channel family protein [Salinisphaera sp. G21_0]
MLRPSFLDFSQRMNRNPAVSMGLLLITLTCSILFSPIVMEYQSIGVTLFSCLMIASLVLTLGSLTENSPKIRLWLEITGTTIVILRAMVEFPNPPNWLPFFSLIASMLFHLGMMLMLIGHLFSVKPQAEKLLAAINFYLLTGITFSYLYLLVNLITPGAFDLAIQGISSWPDYLYFSFVTLTTLGYGDILPLSPLAQGLVSLEAIVGVLSPTVMIARFVGK